MTELPGHSCLAVGRSVQVRQAVPDCRPDIEAAGNNPPAPGRTGTDEVGTAWRPVLVCSPQLCLSAGDRNRAG